MAEDKGRNDIGNDSLLFDLAAYRGGLGLAEQGLAVVANCSIRVGFAIFLRDQFPFSLATPGHSFLSAPCAGAMAIESTRAVLEFGSFLASSDPLPGSRYHLALLLAAAPQIYTSNGWRHEQSELNPVVTIWPKQSLQLTSRLRVSLLPR